MVYIKGGTGNSTGGLVMESVVVELMHNGQRMEYRTVTLSEAKEYLSRPMAKGWHWMVPVWQFETDGGTPEVVLQERQQEALRAVREAE
jgi:hypothetical protein